MKKIDKNSYGLRAVMAIFFIVWAQAIYGAVNAKESLQKSVALFDKGQYEKALEQLQNINIRSDFDNSDDIELAYKIRAIAYAETGQKIKAREVIRELFFLNENYIFDPFDTPTSVIELAHQEKAVIEQKNKYLASVKSEAQEEKAIAGNKEEKIIFIEKKLPAFTTLFPFGINHFLENSKLSGSIYLSAQALSLGINIAAFWWKESYLDGFGSSHLLDPQSSTKFKTAQMLQYIGLGGLLISYCASIIDALIRFQNSNELTS